MTSRNTLPRVARRRRSDQGGRTQEDQDEVDAAPIKMARLDSID